jgi:hypothetical protein
VQQTALLYKEDAYAMNEIKNLDQKRVLDLSADGRIVEIRRKGCVTRITANPDGTLCITQGRVPAAQPPKTKMI